jgi:hypothetical protein
VAHAGDELRLVLSRYLQLSVLVLNLVEQPGILDRDGRLVSEGGDQLDLLVGEWPPGNGVNLRANSSLAGVDSASGFFSGGRGLGLSEPESIGSIKCFSCATAELAAARKRTASRQTTAMARTSL